MLHPGEGNLPKRHQLRSELKAWKDIPHSLQAPETRPPLLIWLGYTCKRKGITILGLCYLQWQHKVQSFSIYIYGREKNPQNQAATLCNAVFTLYCHTVTSMSAPHRACCLTCPYSFYYSRGSPRTPSLAQAPKISLVLSFAPRGSDIIHNSCLPSQWAPYPLSCQVRLCLRQAVYFRVFTSLRP